MGVLHEIPLFLQRFCTFPEGLAEAPGECAFYLIHYGQRQHISIDSQCSALSGSTSARQTADFLIKQTLFQLPAGVKDSL